VHSQIIRIFAANSVLYNMETIQINLNKHIVDQAAQYAHRKGIKLSAMIEEYLLHVTEVDKSGDEPIPNVILSLLGAGEPVGEDDINARESFYGYLEEKYR
jgi:hypothetical protein